MIIKSIAGFNFTAHGDPALFAVWRGQRNAILEQLDRDILHQPSAGVRAIVIDCQSNW